MSRKSKIGVFVSKKSENNVSKYPDTIDTRVALLEMSISHINETLERIDKRLDKMDEKLDRMDAKIDTRFFWLLTLQISSFVGLLGVIARVAHWI